MAVFDLAKPLAGAGVPGRVDSGLGSLNDGLESTGYRLNLLELWEPWGCCLDSGAVRVYNDEASVVFPMIRDWSPRDTYKSRVQS